MTYRVGLTFNLKRVLPSTGGDKDTEAEFDSPKTIGAIRQAIESYGHDVIELEATRDIVTRLPSSGVDVVFNIAEGQFGGRSRESAVPAVLELLNIPYTGSDSATLALALDKVLAKRIVAAAGVATPDYVLMETGDEPIPPGFRFPAIVKPVAEGSSKGVLPSSVVETERELRTLASAMAEKYRQAALVETFLSGREFTVALLGDDHPKVLPPMEVIFVNKARKYPVYAFDHKLDWTEEVRYDRPAQVDGDLGERLERAAHAAFTALGCRDVARIDLRLDQAGVVNFIECNPLPGLSPGWSDLCLIAESAGMDYRTLIGELLAPAIRRLEKGKIFFA